MNAATGSAIVEQEIMTKAEVFDVIQIFSLGVCSGILFITGVFLLSLAVNVFFDIIRK